ncbi:cytochrome C [Flavicella sp.]|uniref:cytochrome C n=1 Tax=Flavicella sp. TaxID=2957742 RepID=UPI00301AE506
MKRLGIISLFVFLLIAFVTIWNRSYELGLEKAYEPLEEGQAMLIIPSEEVFKRFEFVLDYSKMPVDEKHQRSLKTYYNNRAYHGAPPSIPHPVEDEKSLGGNDCLKCHGNGGFVKKWNSYAPVTPHSDYENCRQCHVSVKTNNLFTATNIEKISVPKVGVNSALLGSPPVIPHQIQLRENCLACHAGPSAPKEIRVSHPERVNCRQCHVLKNKEVTDIGIFMRK